ncbi:hypothetical protein QQ14_09410 [Salmonella enterica subsp. enterica]|nr:hypothetical protein [Salmonella enterica]ECH8280007.1 hypothetical protein [Salmonella enterica subsp. enterica]ELT0480635.1 hypothetical protein [Salmonella enterica]
MPVIKHINEIHRGITFMFFSRKASRTRATSGFIIFIRLPAIAQKLKLLKSVSHISVGDQPSKPQRQRGLTICFEPPEKLKSFSTRKPQAGAV